MLLLVGVSAALRAWAAGSIPTPWIAPDELIYADIGRSFWRTGHFALWGHPVALFSAVYPVLAGLPLSLHDRVAGYELLKVVQAVVMSLAAVPVYLWGRELVSRRWAFVAAALALALPSLAYSGLVMTEVAFYPVFVLAAWAIACAVVAPTRRAQAFALGAVVLACATRLEALLLLPAYVAAVALDALAARDARRLRAHAPAAVALVVLAAAWCAWELRHGGPWTNVLGAYRAAGEAGYSFGPAVRFVLYHLEDVVLISGVVPFCALLVLAVPVFRGREADPRVRALVATALSLTAWTVAEVGVFASRHIGHLAERNLFPLVPLLLLALVVWLARGAPRPIVAAGGAAVLALVLLVALPLRTLTTLAATPSSFTQIPLLNIAPHVNLDVAVPVAAAIVLAACAVAPRRLLAVGLPLLLLALGATASVSASRFIVSQSRLVQYLTLGPDRTWVDDHANGSATFLFAGDLNWETPWETRFWNAKLDRAAGFLGQTIPGGLPAPSAGPAADGRLFDDRTGTPLAGDYLITSGFFGVDGEDVAHPVGEVVMWRAAQPLRLHSWLTGVAYDGSVPSGKARYYRYGCDNGGTVHVTVSATDTARTVSFLVNYKPMRTVQLQPGTHASLDLAIPKIVGTCYVDIQTNGNFVVNGISWS